MESTMMQMPLTLAPLLERAGRMFGNTEIVSRLPDRTLHRYRYADFQHRAQALAGALQALGLRPGDRVASLMWNHYAHLEAYFAVPCAGGVLHTLNPRLHPDDIAYIATHAGGRFLIVDEALWPLYEKIGAHTPFESVIVCSRSGASRGTALDYEALIARKARFEPPALGENDAAGLCYTSGTTGKPKGVAYSHRSIVLHSLAIATADYLGVGRGEVICPVVPMFHVNAWGIPHAAVMMGAKLVFPGAHLDAESLLELYESERVTLTAGVPTLWLNVLQSLERSPQRWRLVRGMRMVVGGAAVSEALIRAYDRFGLRVIHGWGMTETSPVGTVNAAAPEPGAGAGDEQYARRARQGYPPPLFEVRATGPEGEVPWDGNTMGELQVRGPWVAARYYGLDAGQWTADGWFRTGDIATIDPSGCVRITDRIKDLIKSGGEWISSIDLENALASHPTVAEAAVVAVPHPKWGERPLAIIVGKAGATPSAEALRAHLAPRFPAYWLPDGFVFVDEMPRTSTGKVLKAALRERYRDGPGATK